MQDNATGDFKITELHDLLVTLKNNYKLLHPDRGRSTASPSSSRTRTSSSRRCGRSCSPPRWPGYNNVNFAVRPRRPKGGSAG